MACSLPQEVLREIFHIATTNDHDYPSHDDQLPHTIIVDYWTGPWYLGQVCRYWRDIVLNFPEIWRSISISLDLVLEHDWDRVLYCYRLQESLRRCQQSETPFRLALANAARDEDANYITDQASFFTSIPLLASSKALYQCTDLTLVLEDFMPLHLSFLPEDSFPHLTVLKVFFIGSSASSGVEGLNCFKQSHKLDIIKISWIHPNRISLPASLPHLSTLYIEHRSKEESIDAEAIRTLLSKANQLRKLRVVLDPFHIQSDNNRILQSTITHFEVAHSDHNVFRNLTLPSLTHLVILNHEYRHFDAEPIILFLIRSQCTLASFSYRFKLGLCPPEEPEELLKIISVPAFSQIREMSFSIQNYEWDMKVFHGFFSRRLHHQGIPSIAPLLEFFEMTVMFKPMGDPPSPLFTPEVLDVIDARMESENPLRKMIINYKTVDKVTGPARLLLAKDQPRVREWERRGLEFCMPGLQ